jgi:hypothetical protein
MGGEAMAASAPTEILFPSHHHTPAAALNLLFGVGAWEVFKLQTNATTTLVLQVP